MAVLTNGDRANINAEFQRELSALFEEIIGMSKSDLRAAINATDSWINSNTTSFNNALPAPAKANMTAKQKARLFFAVAQKRFEVE